MLERRLRNGSASRAPATRSPDRGAGLLDRRARTTRRDPGWQRRVAPVPARAPSRRLTLHASTAAGCRLPVQSGDCHRRRQPGARRHRRLPVHRIRTARTPRCPACTQKHSNLKGEPLMRTLRPILLAMLSLALLGPSTAAVASDHHRVFAAQLLGAHEVPPINTEGSATLKLTIHDASIDFELQYANLSAPPAAAHIHFASPGSTAASWSSSAAAVGQPACPGATSRTVAGTITGALVIGPSAPRHRGGRLRRGLAGHPDRGGLRRTYIRRTSRPERSAARSSPRPRRN